MCMPVHIDQFETIKRASSSSHTFSPWKWPTRN
jgi:hypothetical protein